jgi:hypothetical protein
MSFNIKGFLVKLVAAAALLGVTAASAETLLMPKRDARTTAPVVVWGVTDQVQSAALSCVLDFGDGSPTQACNGVDRSYIAYPHTYAAQGTYTATLTIGAESATTTIQVFNPAAMIGGAAGDNNRSLGINMAIQDGLRFLWTNQTSRAASFPAGTTTNWNNSGFIYADTSLVVLAFENQGYKIQANVPPTGIYEKYIVRRGLNYVLANLGNVALAVTPAGNDPCVAVPAPACTGFAPPGDTGYTTALAILSLAGSGAFAQINTEVAGVTNGKTYGEIAQRLVNALAWGQNDSSTGRGGWYYNFNSTSSDGSTLGWDVLALADAQASGLTVPAWVKTEFATVINTPGGGQLNSNGTWDYQANGALTDNSVGPGKNGIGLQALFLIGEFAGARVDAVKNAVDSWWPGGTSIGGDAWGTGHIGSAYAMFNNFKGLKLHGVATLPQVNRSTHAWKFLGTTGVEDDWYADYQDWFVANQSAPTTIAGGTWGPTMNFSCCASGDAIETAVAELILSPVALVAPDPTLFSSVGLSPAAATNPVFGNHTVTALTQAANNAPVPGVSINFSVLTGPNAGKTGTGTTGADGKTTFTYADTGGAGIDTIQAFIGTTLSSNVVTATWVTTCDVNNDGKVTNADLLLIRGKNGQAASGPGDPYDPNGDGAINVADVRYCQLRLTPQ